MSQDTHKPSVKDGPILREHVFDGIQEYDQKLPNWWLFTFYIMIVLFVCYWVFYYSFGGLESPEQEIKAQMTEIEQARQKDLEAMLDKLDDSVLIEWSQNASIAAEGEQIYTATCIACHAADLNGGVIGRSLVDTHWEYGGKPMDIFNLILNGSPADAKGFNGQRMQAWKDMLGAEKSAKVTAYIISKSPHVDKSAAK